MIKKYGLLVMMLCLAFALKGQNVDFFASDSSGCTPLKVQFNIDLSTVDLDTVNQVKWAFGVGDTITDFNPDTVVYRIGRKYTVTLVLVSDNETVIITKPGFIEAYQTQRADFIYRHTVYGENYRFIPQAVVLDSNKSYGYRWRFINAGTGLMYDDNIRVFNGIKEDGIVYVNLQNDLNAVTGDSVFYASLRIVDSLGCTSSRRDTIVVKQAVHIANVFAPDKGGYFSINPAENLTLNANSEVFDIVLSFEVFSRYGSLVYKEEAPTINWDGRTHNGQDLSPGVYYYVLQATKGDPTGKYSKKGFIHLYR